MKLYDIKEAAQMFSISTWTVRAYIRKGRLHPVRIGRLVRLEERELQRFVSEARSETTASNAVGVDPTPLQEGGICVR